MNLHALIIAAAILTCIVGGAAYWLYAKYKTEKSKPGTAEPQDIPDLVLSDTIAPELSVNDNEKSESIEAECNPLPVQGMHVSVWDTYPTINEIPEEKLNTIWELTHALPRLPGAALNLLPVLSQPGSGAKEVARIIEHDQASAARMLRWVNSSFYGIEGKITSLQHAVAIIGMDAVRSLVLEDSFGRVTTLKGLPGLLPETIWRHAASVSITSRHLAKSVRRLDPDVAATAGLLHDTGLLLMLILDRPKFSEACDAALISKNSLISHETEIFGYNHQVWSEVFIESWQLPEGIKSAVGRHHNPMQEPFDPLAAVIWLADYIVSRIGYSCPEFEEIQTPDNEVFELMKALGLRQSLDYYVTQGLLKEIITATKLWDRRSVPVASFN